MRVENINTMIMKYKIFLWVFLLGAFAACEDNENVFGIMPETGFRFPKREERCCITLFRANVIFMVSK